MSQQPPTQTVIVAGSPEPNIVIRVLWFIFVGWWLSGLAIVLAIVLQWTLIGIPAAVWLINRIPQITTLKSSRRLHVSADQAGAVVVTHADRKQIAWWIRTIYYLLVGWWATAIWMTAAWFASVTLVLMPLGFWMYGQTGKIQTLRR